MTTAVSALAGFLLGVLLWLSELWRSAKAERCHQADRAEWRQRETALLEHLTGAQLAPPPAPKGTPRPFGTDADLYEAERDRRREAEGGYS